MDTSIFRSFSDIGIKEIAPGFFSKLIHTDTNTFNFIDVKAGCSVPYHQHVHEQSSFVIEGIFEFNIDGVIKQLDSSKFVVIPSNVWHSGKAITDCRLIDIFSPVREDYRNL